MLSTWEGDKGRSGIDNLNETGVSFFIRYTLDRYAQSRIKPFCDLGFGLHYLTESSIDNRHMGQHWQAGSNLGIGLLFTRHERMEAGIRIRHLSNGGAAHENQGINFILAKLAFRF